MPIHNSKRKKLSANNTLLLIAASFAAAMGTGVFTFTLPLINLDEKAGGLWLGTGFAGYFLAKLLVAPVSGTISDRFGVKKPLLISTALAMITPVLYLLFPTIQTLYAIQFALGLCYGTIRTVCMAAIGTSMRKEKLASGFSILAAVMNSSFLLGPILGGFLYIDKDYLPVLTAMSLFMGAAFILFLFFKPAILETPAKEREPQSPSSKRNYLYIMIALFGRGAGIGSMIAFLPVMIKSSLLISPGMTGIIYSVPNLATILLLPILGRLMSGFDRRIVTSGGMLLSSVGLFMIASSTTLPWFIFSGLLIGTGAAISIPASMAICTELSPHKGKVMGLANTAANLGFMVGPLFCGTIVSLWGQISTPISFIAMGGALLAVPLLCQGLNRKGMFRTSVASAAVILLTLLAMFPAQVQRLPKNDLEPGIFKYSDVAMGTVVNLTLISPVHSETEAIARETITIMHELQKDFDHRNKRGSVGMLNHAAGKHPVKVSERTFKVIERGLEISEKSRGNFDITIGAITTTPFYYALDKSRFEKHKDLVNYRLVEIYPEEKKVHLPLKGMALDLGGLAKGTIIDGAADHLKQSGIKTALVEAGGDFMAFGDRQWTIGIRNPRGKDILGSIKVQNMAVCGSGDYYQFITPISLDDKTRKHHIFDPALLQSSAESIATTVIAPKAETADALATTVFIMGPEKGAAFIKEYFPDCSAMWVLPDMTVRTTANFPEIHPPENARIENK